MYRVKLQHRSKKSAKLRYSVQKWSGSKWKTVKGQTYSNMVPAMKKVALLNNMEDWRVVPISS